ncbi:MAG: XRE family transcriptional regulator [Clostridia bacterium]
MQIDEPLKMVCVKNDLTMAEIARRLDVSPQAFSQKMKRGTFTLDDLDSVAAVAGCKLECNLILAGGEKIALV